MANLPETPDYPAGIYQLETSDPVLGGAGGISNRQAEQLANRTSWLKAKVDAFIDGTVAVFKATKLATARTLSISGAGSGSASFDGSANANIVLTLADSGAVAGTYPKVTINAKGIVTAGAAMVPADIPNLDWSKITSGKPSTLGGYGITDAQPLDATLTALAAQITAANKLIYATGADAFAVTDLTAFARTLLDDASAAAALATLGAAPLASPGMTGVPTVPTAGGGTNTTQVASTAFVQAAVGGYLSKATTGGTVTLTDAEASNPVIAVSGALTSASVVVLPTTTKRLWAIYNATSGAFSMTVKTAAGTGVTIAQGKRNLVYTDGTNIYDAFNDFESIALTGIPTAPTAAAGTNTTQLATTAFVIAQILSSLRGLSCFHAIPSASQSLSAGVTTRINFATEVFDTANNYTPASSRFTAPVAGYYEFDAAVHFTGNGSSADNGGVELWVDGAVERRIAESFGPRNQLSGSSGPIWLAAGSYVQIYAWSDLAANINQFPALTYFNGKRIS